VDCGGNERSWLNGGGGKRELASCRCHSHLSSSTISSDVLDAAARHTHFLVTRFRSDACRVISFLRAYNCIFVLDYLPANPLVGLQYSLGLCLLRKDGQAELTDVSHLSINLAQLIERSRPLVRSRGVVYGCTSNTVLN